MMESSSDEALVGTNMKILKVLPLILTLLLSSGCILINPFPPDPDYQPQPHCTVGPCSTAGPDSPKAYKRGLHNFADHESKATANLVNQICRFDCNEVIKACFNSINENEDTSGTLLCEKEKEMCFNRCDNEIGIKFYNPKPDDCDPGLESCN